MHVHDETGTSSQSPTEGVSSSQPTRQELKTAVLAALASSRPGLEATVVQQIHKSKVQSSLRLLKLPKFHLRPHNN